MSDKQSNKMTGIDVYICIDNSREEKHLTIGKPYRVVSMCRDCVYDIYFLIKNDTRQTTWYKSTRFRPRNTGE